MLILPLLHVLSGCGGANRAVYEGYEAAKGRALKDPGPASASWDPDVRIELSPPLLDGLLRHALEQNGTYSSEVVFPLGRATPTLEVKKVTLSPSSKCQTCFTVDLELDGSMAWQAGVLGKGDVPATAEARLEVELSTEKAGSDWLIKGLPRDVRNVKVAVPGWSATVERAASAPLERWLNEKVEKIEPMTLTTFGGEGLPLRAVQVKPQGKGLSILALTTTPSPGKAPTGNAQLPDKGFAVWVGFETLVGFAAAKAFEEGPQAYDVVAVPTSLTSKKAGFTLGLRLWGLGGAGWWRDYTATGGIAIQDGEVRLSPTEVQQIGASPGAIQADPLVYLAEGVILDAISDAMRVSLPNVYDAKVGTNASSTTIDGLRGDATSLRVSGDIVLQALKGKGSKRKAK